MTELARMLDGFVNYFRKHGWTVGTYQYYQNLHKELAESEKELQELRLRVERAEMATRAMWPIFALALAYSEHGSNSEHNNLRRIAGNFREDSPDGAMDAILKVVDTGTQT